MLKARRSTTPLSVSQERLWLWEQLGPGTALLNVARCLSLSGQLDRALLEHSVREIAHRHESLRTSIVSDDFTPLQVVSDHVELDLGFVDLGELDEAERKAELNRLTHREARRPFDLTRAPLLRLCLVRIAPEQHRLIIVASRLVWDEDSFAVFRRDLCRIYPALERGETPRLKEPPTSYRDFSSWHRAWLLEPWAAKDLEYWRTALAGATLELELPTDRPRPALRSYRTGSIAIDVNSRLIDEIRALSQRESTTPFSVMLAAFATALHRYSGHREIAVETPVSWRVHPDLEELIGTFSNTLLLRTVVAPDLSFRELLSHVDRTSKDSFEHRDLPYEQVIRASRQQHERARPPPLRIWFSASEAGDLGGEMAGLKLAELALETGAGAPELSLSMRLRDDRAEATIEYSCDLFERTTVQRFADSLMLCLGAAVARPETEVARLPILPASIAQRVLREWNATAVDYQKDQLIHELFSARARERPEKAAVFFEGTTLSFRQIEERANQLAHELIERGAGPGRFVGICLERGPALVIGLLAILKSGSAYLPLDPGYPRERIAYMLEDAEARLVLTERRSAGVVSESGVEPFLVDDPETLKRVSSQARTVPAQSGAGAQLAYIIYTSGSTGRPKGVLLEHRNVVNFFAGMEVCGLLEPPGVWLAATSICFDISVLEILGALTHGFEVTLLGGARLGDAANSEFGIASLIGRRGVTHFQCTPSQARMLLADPVARGALARLEHLLVGGEALPASLAEQLLNARLWRSRQHVRSHRNRHLVDDAPLETDAGQGADRPSDRQYPALRARRSR